MSARLSHVLFLSMTVAACSRGSEPKQEPDDSNRVRQDELALVQELEEIPKACPAGGRCFLSTTERENQLTLLQMQVMLAADRWWEAIRKPTIREALVAKPERLPQAIATLLGRSASSRWHHVLEPAESEMQRNAEQLGGADFLSAKRPKVPIVAIIREAAKLGDAELVSFTKWWHQESRPESEFARALADCCLD